MYIFKNALRNIRRAKLRNFLIGVIVLIIAIASCLGLSIRQAANNAREEGLAELSITAQISMDRQSMMQGFGGDRDQMLQNLQKMEALTLEEMQGYAENENVKDFYYSLSVSVNGNDDISAVQTQASDDDEESSMGGFPGGRFPGGGKQMMGGMGQQGDFTLSAYSSFDAITAFNDGTSEITDGAFFTIDETAKQCVISDELATLNELEIGDKITLQNPNDDDETITFKVVGIYHNEQASVGGGMMQGFMAAMDPANTIYVPYEPLRKAVENSEKNAETTTDEETGRTKTTAMRGSESGTYVFADTASFEAFKSSVELPDGYSISSSDVERFEQSLLPLNSLSQFAGWFLLIVLLIGGLILIVFNIFSVRERKSEIGVLTAIGMKKGKVCMQFLAEMFVVTFIALIIGAVIGSVASVPATNALLASQNTTYEQQETNRFDRFGFDESGMPPNIGGDMQPPPDMGGDRGGFFGQMGGMMTDYISEVTSATDFTVLLQLLGIGLGLTLVSSLAALSAIMRYDPLKILTNA